MSLRVRVCGHCGPAAEGGEYHDAIVTDLTQLGASIYSTTTFGRGDLLQIQFVRPSRRNSAIGQRITVVARVARERRLGRNAKRPTTTGIEAKRLTTELGVEFVCIDQSMAEWLRELTGAVESRLP